MLWGPSQVCQSTQKYFGHHERESNWIESGSAAGSPTQIATWINNSSSLPKWSTETQSQMRNLVRRDLTLQKHQAAALVRHLECIWQLFLPRLPQKREQGRRPTTATKHFIMSMRHLIAQFVQTRVDGRLRSTRHTQIAMNCHQLMVSKQQSPAISTHELHFRTASTSAFKLQTHRALPNFFVGRRLCVAH